MCDSNKLLSFPYHLNKTFTVAIQNLPSTNPLVTILLYLMVISEVIFFYVTRVINSRYHINNNGPLIECEYQFGTRVSFAILTS